MRRALLTLLLLTSLLAPTQRAHAHGDMGGGMGALGEGLYMLFLVALAELAIPDVRGEFGDDGAAADLGWPFTFTWLRIGDYTSDPDAAFSPIFFLRSSAEVHFETDKLVVRGVFTGRVDIVVPIENGFGAGLALEGGYVVGDDSDAPLAGGGLLVDFQGLADVILQYRATFVDELRHDITLQLEIPIPVNIFYQDIF